MLRELARKREEMIEIEDTASLLDLVMMIAKVHGPKLQDCIFQSKYKLKDGFAYAVNGDTIDLKQLGRRSCGSVKEFAILPPISGGMRKQSELLQTSKRHRSLEHAIWASLE